MLGRQLDTQIQGLEKSKMETWICESSAYTFGVYKVEAEIHIILECKTLSGNV